MLHQTLHQYSNLLWLLDNRFDKRMELALEPKSTQSLVDNKPQFNSANTKAVVNIVGTLLPECDPWMEEYGYCSMSRVSEEIANMPSSVKELVLYINTGGGTVNGTVELADQIAKCRKKMNVVAYTDQICCSGGYMLASQASKIICAPTATIGSIGVVLRYYKVSTEDYGYKVITLQEGANKTFGSPYTPDSEEERKYFQEQLRTTYEMFCNAVSEGRGVSVEQIKKTEATADFAVNMPKFLYDEIMTKQDFKATL